jgi:hypothetical protein
MTEPLPPDSTGSAQPAETSPAPAKKSWPISRTILLAILAILLVMLGFDYFHGRAAKDKAYDLLTSKFFPEGKSKAVIQRQDQVLADQIHQALGRDPDRVEDDPAKAARLMQDEDDEGGGGFGVVADKVETYRFAGALRAYVVRVAYQKSKVADGQYTLSDIKGGTEPLF